MFAFPCLGVLREVKKVFAFPQMFRFDLGSSKGISKQNRKKLSAKCAAILPRRKCHYQCQVKTNQLMQLRRLHCTKICESSNKIQKNIGHSFCARNGVHLGLSIETESIQKKERCRKLSFGLFKTVGGGGET